MKELERLQDMSAMCMRVRECEGAGKHSCQLSRIARDSPGKVCCVPRPGCLVPVI